MGNAVDMMAREADLDQRIAILRRYRRMLELQRSHLQEYLALIDTREMAVRTGDVDKLENYTHIEQGVIKGIMSVQKCLEPLAALYRQAAPEGSPDIDELQDRLDHLRTTILARNEENIGILKLHMDKIRVEINSLRIPKTANPVFTAAAAPQLLNITG